MIGIGTAIACWAVALLLAANASGCDPSKEPPTPEPKKPDPAKPKDGNEAQKKLQEITGPTCQKTCNPFAEDGTGLLMLRGDRVSAILSEICPGVKEAIAKDQTTLAPEILERGLRGLASYYSREKMGTADTDFDRKISLNCKTGFIDKTDPLDWNNLAYWYEKKGEMDKAERASELALATATLERDSFATGNAFLGLGDVNRHRGSHAWAIDYYQKAIRSNPEVSMATSWGEMENPETWLAKEDQKEYLPQYQKLLEEVAEANRGLD